MANANDPQRSSDTNSATPTDDPVQAFIYSAEKVMVFAGDLPYRRFEPGQRLKGQLALDGETRPMRDTLYENASSALEALYQTGTDFGEAESQVKRVVAICNDFLKWGWHNVGQAPPMPDGSKEPDQQLNLVWTDRQSRLVEKLRSYFEV